MPIFEYECTECGKRMEKLERNGDSPLKKCVYCEGGVFRVLSAPMIKFKGTGWYITDYQDKEKTQKTKKQNNIPTPAASTDNKKSKNETNKNIKEAKAV